MRTAFQIDAAPTPEHITADPIPVRTGERYLVAVTISGFFLGKLASVSKIRRKAEEEGFRDVIVTEGSPPPGSPSNVTADYFVVGTFSGPDRAFGRSQAGGDVHIVDAWNLSGPPPPPPPPPPPEDRSTGKNSDWILADVIRASITGDEAVAEALKLDLANARRVEDPNAPPGSYSETDALTQVLSAQNRGAPPEVIQIYVRAYEKVRSPLSPSLGEATATDLRRIVMKRHAEEKQRRTRAEEEERKAAQEGAKLGHLRFGESPGVSFGTIRKQVARPRIGLGEEIEDRLFNATLRRIGAVALVTSPFWLLVLLAPRSYR